MRPHLISAINSCVEARLQRRSRAFLQGLSTDELEYIAEFLGACVLEPAERATERSQVAATVAQFERMRRADTPPRSDREHKMILLLEFLSRCRVYPAVSFNSRIQMFR